MVRTLGTLKNHPAVDRALDSAAAHLTDAGHEIEELTDFPSSRRRAACGRCC